MITFLLILFLTTTAAAAVFYVLKERAEAAVKAALETAEVARRECQSEIARTREESRAAAILIQQELDQTLAALSSDSERVRAHYENEALRVHQEKTRQLEIALAELVPLRGYASLQDAEAEVSKMLGDAITEATALKQEAQLLVELTREATAQERTAAQLRAREITAQANALLVRASRDAGAMVETAERRAEQIGGNAYVALRDKETLEEAVGALWNVVEGYGDRYVIPTRSILDDLAADFNHVRAGEELKAAREQTSRLVELKLASTCNYEEVDRRDRANRFVVDAFNGRVDAILSRTKHDNYGTLEKEIRDAFSVVNLNGLVFRDARVLPAYLDSRLNELKWAVIALELRLQEREEQRELQERIREEEKVRREYERALQEAARDEALIRQAMARARAEAEHASAEERATLEAELARLNQQLAEAEAKGQRALSMAQQTRSGNVYIISNVGSFGDDVVKIGMTRRLIPEDRVRELSDASVPFRFDVHAMIQSEDAPALERMLHKAFEDVRINKVNYRKEFFRMPLERVRAFAEEHALEFTLTMAAEAREYRETLALEKMTPEERERYRTREIAEEEPLELEL